MAGEEWLPWCKWVGFVRGWSVRGNGQRRGVPSWLPMSFLLTWVAREPYVGEVRVVQEIMEVAAFGVRGRGE